MSYVYFIGVAETSQSWVKIGCTSGSPYDRIRSLQTGCPFPLSVLAYAPGDNRDEKRLHNRFDEFRGFGEWFTLQGEFQEYLCDLIAGSRPMRPADTLYTSLYLKVTA